MTTEERDARIKELKAKLEEADAWQEELDQLEIETYIRRDEKDSESAQANPQNRPSDIQISVTREELHQIIVGLWQGSVTLSAMGGPSTMYRRANQYRALAYRLDAVIG